MDTKLCPYCKEEIKIDALKCKHCGEFLNKQEVAEEVITFELENCVYSRGFYLCIVTTVYSIVEAIIPDLEYTKYGVLNIIALVGIGLYMSIYLHSYKKNKLTIPMAIYFVLMVGMSILSLIMGKDDNNSVDISFLLVVILVVFYTPLFLASTIAGVQLIRFKNDQVGWMKELGYSMCIVPFIVFGTYLVAEFYDSTILKFVAATIDSIPFVFIALILKKADSL